MKQIKRHTKLFLDFAQDSLPLEEINILVPRPNSRDLEVLHPRFVGTIQHYNSPLDNHLDVFFDTQSQIKSE